MLDWAADVLQQARFMFVNVIQTNLLAMRDRNSDNQARGGSTSVSRKPLRPKRSMAESGTPSGITKGCTRSTHSGGCEVVKFLFVPGEPRRYPDEGIHAKAQVDRNRHSSSFVFRCLQRAHLVQCVQLAPLSHYCRDLVHSRSNSGTA